MAVKKRNCLRRVRRLPKASEADYKAEFFVLGQSQAQQRRATSLLPAIRAKAKSAAAKSNKPFARNPSEGEKQRSKIKGQAQKAKSENQKPSAKSKYHHTNKKTAASFKMPPFWYK
ncbi:MAG: hypothetical protein IIX29_06985 [Bacteroidales bacterium]|nr:hypothetical protein [Bacteroidales bacterium]